jgi:C4-dicarboxylate-specific signal transduction histidine kinase
VFRLGLWALNVTASGLALVTGDQITMRNARWNELDDVSSGGWMRDAEFGKEVYVDLNQLARAEAARVPERTPGTTVRRFRRARGEQVLEVRLERPGSDRTVVLVIAHDVTDQARAQQDLSEMREALLQNERLALLGELATSVSHDLGNTLRGISARVSVLALDVEIGKTRAPLLTGLQESVEAALDSVRKLQDLARSGRLEPGPVQLAEVVRHAVDVLQLRQPHDGPPIEVRASVAGAPPVLGTVSELSHLFVTLLFNARDAMPKGGRVEVNAERRKDGVCVTVCDEGTGIAPEHLPHLFEPFFTTKGKAGTGLGLWLASNTMRRFGGTIAARNHSRGGAEFKLEFRVAGNGELRPARVRARRSGPSARSS